MRVLWELGRIFDDFFVVLGAILGSKIDVFGTVFEELLKTYDFRNIAPHAGEKLVLKVHEVKLPPKTEAKRREETGFETGGFWG